MIDAIGAKAFTRWMAIAELDGWGEDHRTLLCILAALTHTPLEKLLPDYAKRDNGKQPVTNNARLGLNRLAGF